MRPEILRTLPLLLAISVVPASVSGQAADPQGGFWWEVSAAAGAGRLTCSLCDRTRELGPSVGASIGAYATPTFRVGVDGAYWSHDDDGDRETVYRAGLVGQLHPRPGKGLHLIGGVGWSGYRAEALGYDAARLTLGVGWDLRLTDTWMVGNRLTVDGSSYGSLNNEDTPVAQPVGLSVVRLGVYLRKR